ncbi:MAG: hypothetical protein ACT4PT_11365 [Methanobacteriota archaeon]
MSPGDGPAANAFQGPETAAARTAPGADDGSGTRFTAYVGYDPATFDPSGPYDREAVEAALLAWKAEHRNDRVLDQQAVFDGPFLIGYRIEFEEGDREPEIEVVKTPE